MGSRQRTRSINPYSEVQISETAELIAATRRELERLRQVLAMTQEQIDKSRQIIAEWQHIREQVDTQLPK